MNKNKIFIHILCAVFLLASCKNDYVAELERAHKTVPVMEIYFPDGNSVSRVKGST